MKVISNGKTCSLFANNNNIKVKSVDNIPKLSHPVFPINNTYTTYGVTATPWVESYTQNIKGVVLDKHTCDMYVDELYVLRKSVIPVSSSNQNVVWHVQDETILSCIEGLIVPKKVGATNVIVTTVDGSYYDFCEVTVNNRPVETIIYNIYNLIPSDFGISIDGTNATSTRQGLNNAFQYCVDNDYNKIIFPVGTYLIDEQGLNIPSNLLVDLNTSIIKLQPHGVNNTKMISFLNTNNSALCNGTLYGDKGLHTVLSDEAVHGIVFSGSNNIKINDVTITKMHGYGIQHVIGVRKNTQYIQRQNIENGAYDKGVKVYGNEYNCRTIAPINISNFNEFEIGNPFGGYGYPYISSRVTYDIDFYDNDMNYITRYCFRTPFVTYAKPKNAKYCNITFNNTYWISSAGNSDMANSIMVITEFNFNNNVEISNCRIEECFALGIAYISGGRKNVVRNCIFRNNGGQYASCDVDLEDGWEYMQDFILRDCTFQSKMTNIVLCAGSNNILYNNHIAGLVQNQTRSESYIINNNLISTGGNSNLDISNGRFGKHSVFADNTVENYKVTLKSELNDSSKLLLIKNNIFKGCTITKEKEIDITNNTII